MNVEAVWSIQKRDHIPKPAMHETLPREVTFRARIFSHETLPHAWTPILTGRKTHLTSPTNGRKTSNI